MFTLDLEIQRCNQKTNLINIAKQGLRYAERVCATVCFSNSIGRYAIVEMLKNVKFYCYLSGALTSEYINIFNNEELQQRRQCKLYNSEEAVFQGTQLEKISAKRFISIVHTARIEEFKLFVFIESRATARKFPHVRKFTCFHTSIFPFKLHIVQHL